MLVVSLIILVVEHTVVGISSSVTEAPHEWLGAIIGPVSPVVEPRGIKDDLIEQLWQPHGVRGRARASRLESSAFVD